MDLDTSFDLQFEHLSELNWLPWVGKNYKGKKVLLIGESHYDDEDGWLYLKDATRKFVNNQGLNSNNPDFKNRRIFQQIEKTLLNKEMSSLEEREAIWTSVSYYNLVQRLLPSRKERPTDEDYDLGWRIFLDVVEILKPEVCIKYGYDGIGRLGNLLNLYDTGWKRDNVMEFYNKPYCINLTKNDFKLKIVFTPHPTGSFAFDYITWAEHIRQNYSKIEHIFEK